MGGEGTFRDVAAGLYTSARCEDVALGMLPTGTANDQGESFGLQADESALARNVDVIRAAHETRLDVSIRRAGRPSMAYPPKSLLPPTKRWRLHAQATVIRRTMLAW